MVNKIGVQSHVFFSSKAKGNSQLRQEKLHSPESTDLCWRISSLPGKITSQALSTCSLSHPCTHMPQMLPGADSVPGTVVGTGIAAMNIREFTQRKTNKPHSKD